LSRFGGHRKEPRPPDVPVVSGSPLCPGGPGWGHAHRGTPMTSMSPGRLAIVVVTAAACGAGSALLLTSSSGGVVANSSSRPSVAGGSDAGGIGGNGSSGGSQPAGGAVLAGSAQDGSSRSTVVASAAAQPAAGTSVTVSGQGVNAGDGSSLLGPVDPIPAAGLPSVTLLTTLQSGLTSVAGGALSTV